MSATMNGYTGGFYRKMPDKLKIAYLGLTDMTEDRNRTRYQRPRYLSDRSELYFFVRKGSLVPEEMTGRVNIVRSEFRSVILHLLWTSYAVMKMNRKLKFDFIYTCYAPHSILQGFFLKMLGLRWIADIWDHPEQGLADRSMNPGKRLLVFGARKTLKRADLVICAIMPEALGAYAIDSRKILSITNGVDLKLVKPVGDGGKGISRHLRLLYVGPIHPSRDIETVLEAFHILYQKNQDLELKMVGGISGDFDKMMRFIKSRGMEDKVEFKGEIQHKEVIDLIEDSDICLCPLRNTIDKRFTYPIKVFEYLAMGKVVIAANLPGVAEIIDHGENGLLVNPEDAKALADAVIEVQKNDLLREKLERNARPSVERFDWDSINSRVIAALVDLKASRTGADFSSG